jgi:hypothetical protein
MEIDNRSISSTTVTSPSSSSNIMSANYINYYRGLPKVSCIVNDNARSPMSPISAIEMSKRKSTRTQEAMASISKRASSQEAITTSTSSCPFHNRYRLNRRRQRQRRASNHSIDAKEDDDVVYLPKLMPIIPCNVVKNGQQNVVCGRYSGCGMHISNCMGVYENRQDVPPQQPHRRLSLEACVLSVPNK